MLSQNQHTSDIKKQDEPLEISLKNLMHFTLTSSTIR